jgi:hypothetical protein
MYFVHYSIVRELSTLEEVENTVKNLRSLQGFKFNKVVDHNGNEVNLKESDSSKKLRIKQGHLEF